MAHDVFICHSSKDKTVADAACAALEQRGLRCWIAPRDVLPGTSWAASIVAAIDGAKIMLLIFSSNANAAPQIEREIERAANRRIPIVPFRIADILPTDALEYFISASHWLDAYSPPIERHYQTLADKIKTLLTNLEAPPGAEPLSVAPPPPVAIPTVATKSSPPWPLVAGGGALAGVVLVGLILVMGRSPNPPPAPQPAVPAAVAPPPAPAAAQPPDAAAAPAEATAETAPPSAASSPPTGPAYASYPINLDPNGDNWVALRSAPNGLGVRLDKLGPDAQFAVLGTEGDWSQVQMPDGRTGWVASHYIGCCRVSR